MTRENKTETITNLNYSFNPSDCTISDTLKIVQANKKQLSFVLQSIILDSKSSSAIPLGEYTESRIQYLIQTMPVNNYSLLNCAEWLSSTTFKTFTIKKVIIRYETKEIIVITNNVTDDVLDEFYDATYNYTHKNDREIVFMITTEQDINYSTMPKYDKVIEVE